LNSGVLYHIVAGKIKVKNLLVDGGDRAGDHTAATVGTSFRVQHHGVFVKPEGFQRKYFFRAGSDAPSATTATKDVDCRHNLKAVYSPRSICFHVNSGFVCLRLKG
jgi:hypothetical protein